jgi:hypothetical protein
MGDLLAKRASGFGCFYRQGQDEHLWGDLDLIQAQVSRQTKEKGWLDHGLGLNQEKGRKQYLRFSISHIHHRKCT